MTNKVSSKEKLTSLVKSRQFYWWLGHVVVALNGIFYFSSVLSLNSNISFYKRAYLGVLLSYAIVIYNSIEVKYKSLDFSILSDENIHYFVLGFYWYSYSPITVSLIPFFIFSIFHLLSYFRTTLLPIIKQITTEFIEDIEFLFDFINDKIKFITDNYHTTAIYYVSYIEVNIILTRIILGILMFQTSFLALIVFTHFLRLRYHLSDHTKEAIKNTVIHLDQWLIFDKSFNHSSSHLYTILNIISNIYISIKRIIIRYGNISNKN